MAEARTHERETTAKASLTPRSPAFALNPAAKRSAETPRPVPIPANRGKRSLDPSARDQRAGKAMKSETMAQSRESIDVYKRQVLALIPEGSTVGVPGSSTIRELGLFETLRARGCKILEHWDPALAPEDKLQRLEDENTSGIYLSSSNGVTLDGKLVNIDGTGNRVAAMAWARNRIIFVVGINKISRDVETAIQRIRDVATPLNAISKGVELPCVKTGFCVDCRVPNRYCRATLVLERNPCLLYTSRCV